MSDGNDKGNNKDAPVPSAAGEPSGAAPRPADAPESLFRLLPREISALGKVFAAVTAFATVASVAGLFVRGNRAIVLVSVGFVVVCAIGTIVFSRTGGRTVTMGLRTAIAFAAVPVAIGAALVAGVVIYNGNSPAHPAALAGPTSSPTPAVTPATTPAPATSAPAATTAAAATTPTTPTTTTGPCPSGLATPTPPAQSASAPPVRHQGLLCMTDSGPSYDLDSTASDWGAGTGTWASQNIQFFGESELALPDEPEYDVLLGTDGGWTYQTCASANYIMSFSSSQNPNTPTTASLTKGSGICVKTFDNSTSKTDGGHYALLVVVSHSPHELVFEVTVWQATSS